MSDVVTDPPVKNLDPDIPTFALPDRLKGIFSQASYGQLSEATTRNPHALAAHLKAYLNRLASQSSMAFETYPTTRKVIAPFPKQLPPPSFVEDERAYLLAFFRDFKLPPNLSRFGPNARNDLRATRLDYDDRGVPHAEPRVNNDVRSTNYVERGEQTFENNRKYENNIPRVYDDQNQQTFRITRNDRVHPRRAVEPGLYIAKGIGPMQY